MKVVYHCLQCDQTSVSEFEATSHDLHCSRCAATLPISPGTITQTKLVRCLVCSSAELFVRKDFPQVLGVAIVVLAAIVSSIFWFLRMPFWTYGTLFTAALIDLILYIFVGNQLQCYRCQAQYRGVSELENHEPFDLETHEKYRQQTARLSEAGKVAH